MCYYSSYTVYRHLANYNCHLSLQSVMKDAMLSIIPPKINETVICLVIITSIHF